MKVFLLCVDGLEHDFVGPRAFPHLKQARYAKIEIPSRFMTHLPGGLAPYSPVMWRIIFTGRPQRAPRKQEEFWTWNNRVVRILRKQSKLCRLYKWAIKQGLVNAGAPAKFGFKREATLVLPEETFVAFASNPIVIHDPLLPAVQWDEGVMRDFTTFARMALRLFRKERHLTLQRIKEPWDLFIIYTRLLDIMGHYCWQKNCLMASYYYAVDQFAEAIQARLLPDTVMLILSDHGMRPLHGTNFHGGEHSPHAFVSFNYPLRLPKPFGFTEIYPLIKTLLEEGN